jgi:hypothetical protein
MKLRQALIACSVIASIAAYGQNSVGIGVANPNKNAVLELISPGNNQGLLIPKLTTVQRTSASFTGALSVKENGLMVFDSDENKFYYWEVSQWKALGTGSELSGGTGISIINNTVSTIPQDIQLAGSALTITNNPAAVPIDLSDINIPQDIQVSGSTLTVTNNPSAIPINLSDLNIPQDIQVTGSTLTVTNNPSAVPINLADINIPQDLQLTGSQLTITNNPSATPINLSAFTGTNTDDQTLTFDGATGNLAITRLSGGPQTINIPTTTPPSGTAGGDLAGSYPNPAVANNAINSAKIADGTIASADIADGTIASVDILDGTVASVDILDGTVTTNDIANGTVASIDITDGTIVSADIADGTIAGVDILDATVTTADIADGTVASADITDNTITTNDISDGTIGSVDIAALGVADANIAAGVAVSKLTSGTLDQVLTTTAGGTAWANPPTAIGTAGGDLTGTYPNPAVANNAINSAKIADGTIASVDLLDGTVASVDILDGTVTTTDIADGTVASADIADNTITTNDINDGTIGSVDIAALGVADANIATGVAVGKLAPGTLNQVLTTTVGGTVWANPVAAGAAGGDLGGTYPNPTVNNNAITSAKINDGAIVDADVNATANLAVSKLAPSATPGQILTTSGGIAQWSAPGASALIAAPGTRNLAAGAVMAGVAGGTDNAFYGYGAGNLATTGSWNVYIGTEAGRNTVSGSLNTIIGWRAGHATTPVGFNGNTLVGAQAGQFSVDGPNTFIGEKAGQNNIDGTHSVHLGNSAGIINTIGYQNTILGSLANLSANNLFNATAIGYNTVVDASNKVRIGNAAVTVIHGQVGFTAASDRRLKTNISPFQNGLDVIMKLKPVSYNMKNSSDSRTNWGFIAQDIESLVGSDNAILTVSGDKERTLGLRYTDFVAPLVKAVQEQQGQITDLNNKLTESEKKVDFLVAEIEKLKKAVGLKAENK